MSILTFVLFLCLLACYSVAAVRYTPDWKSLDSRQLPQWYDDAKVGIFLHWGVFSAPSFGVGDARESAYLWLNWRNNVTDAIQYMKQNFPPDFTYADFASTFHAEFFNPDEWADIFKSARVKLVSVFFVLWHIYNFCNLVAHFRKFCIVLVVNFTRNDE